MLAFANINVSNKLKSQGWLCLLVIFREMVESVNKFINRLWDSGNAFKVRWICVVVIVVYLPLAYTCVIA